MLDLYGMVGNLIEMEKDLIFYCLFESYKYLSCKVLVKCL